MRFFSLLLAGSLLQASVGDKLISQTVGSAGGRYVTSREVQGHYMIETVLNGPPLKNGFDFLQITNDLFLDQVNSLLFEIMLSLESDSFNFSTVKPIEIERDVDRLKKFLKMNKEIESKFEFSENELERWIRQNKVAKNFLKFKTDSMKVNVSDTEALSHYEKNKSKFGNVKFETIKSNVINFLNKEQLQDRLKSYLEVIKRKYKANNTLADLNGI